MLGLEAKLAEIRVCNTPATTRQIAARRRCVFSPRVQRRRVVTFLEGVPMRASFVSIWFLHRAAIGFEPANSVSRRHLKNASNRQSRQQLRPESRTLEMLSGNVSFITAFPCISSALIRARVKRVDGYSSICSRLATNSATSFIRSSSGISSCSSSHLRFCTKASTFSISSSS